MQWYKFSFLIILFTSFNADSSQFTSQNCLESSFKTSVQNKGQFFGLIKNNLDVSKDKCKLSIKFKGILETVWDVDVCREPIHMKVTSKGSQSVYKRTEKCSEDNKSDFCYFRNELILNLQDQGLIFAKGEREKIEDSHGKIYCTYLLLSKYLDEGLLFSQYAKSFDLYIRDKVDPSNCEIPSTNKAALEGRVDDEKVKPLGLKPGIISSENKSIQSGNEVPGVSPDDLEKADLLIEKVSPRF
jgi:hypothetical protein